MSQIGLPFAWGEQAGPGEFIVAQANRLAASHIARWREWPIPISILSGPPRSGKSLLGRHFAAISGGTVIEDANHRDNQALFHAWNTARDSGVPLLLIAREAPQSWTVSLPDLRSRIAAAPHVRIDEPDEALVIALIEAGLGQAGSAFAADVPAWLARRIERSYSAVAEVLHHLNALSLASARKITLTTAKEALQKTGFLPIEGHDHEQSSDAGKRGGRADNV